MAPNQDISLIRPCDVSQDQNPILYSLVKSYREFINCYYKVKGNYKDMVLFDNENFHVGMDNTTFNVNFIGNIEYRDQRLAYRRITFSQCFINGGVKSAQELQRLGLNLNPAKWLL